MMTIPHGNIRKGGTNPAPTTPKPDITPPPPPEAKPAHKQLIIYAEMNEDQGCPFNEGDGCGALLYAGDTDMRCDVNTLRGSPIPGGVPPDECPLRFGDVVVKAIG